MFKIKSLLIHSKKQCTCKDKVHMIICNKRIERKKKLAVLKIRSNIMNFNTNRFQYKNVTNVRLFTKIENDNNGVPYFYE